MEIAQIRIQPLDERGAPGRRRPPRPETADLGFLEDVVPAKYLVGPFSREYHFAAVVPGDLRQQEQRRGSGAQKRRLGMPYDVGKDSADIVVGAAHLHVIGLQRTDDLPLIVAFVEFSFVERDREGADRP